MNRNIEFLLPRKKGAAKLNKKVELTTNSNCNYARINYLHVTVQFWKFSLDIFIHGLFTAIRVYKEDGCVGLFGKEIVYVLCKLA